MKRLQTVYAALIRLIEGSATTGELDTLRLMLEEVLARLNRHHYAMTQKAYKEKMFR